MGPRGREPQPPVHEGQEGTQNSPGGRAELWKGQDTQCCQPRWQLGPPRPWLGTSFSFPTMLEHAAGSKENQLQSPPQQGLVFHSPLGEAEELFQLQKSLPTPCLEQKVPAHMEAWKTLRDLGSVGNKPLPQIPIGELGSGGMQVWGGSAPPGEGLVGDKGTHCHI